MRRVVVTGLGVVSPLGSDLNTFWDNLRAGRSGIRKITKFDAKDYTAQIAGEVVGLNPDSFVAKKEQRRMDLFSLYAVCAAKMAVADAGIDFSKEDADRIGVIIGSGVGGMTTMEAEHSVMLQKGPMRCSPFMIPMMITNMASGLIAIEYGLKGPNFSVVTACASAGHSMGESLRIIQRGDADIIISGGAEACVTQLAVAGFCSLRALCTTSNDQPEKASRPFDKNRGGFIIAEGGAILMLEEYEHAKKRGAKIYCELAGYGATCDAFHITAPADSGEGAAKAMKIAIKDAGLTPEGIDYVNAHGTSTELNDKIETRAIKTALGEDRARKVMVSSTKSMTGHLLGAAAAIESIAIALALRDGVVPPTINYETPDPECDLDYVPNTARQVAVKAALKNSLGFGGHNACLVFKKM